MPELSSVRLRIFPLVLLLVCISGAAALVYEVVWSRQLTIFLGITAHAHTAVIASFMTGLTLGSIAGGRISGRIRRPLLWYALIEIAIGIYALASPGVFKIAEAAYVAMTPALGIGGSGGQTIRFVAAFACLLVPTVLMGSTLPLLVEGLRRSGNPVGEVVSRLYGVNTVGAAMGTFLAGYFLLPAFGVRGTSVIAAALSVLAGLGVLVLCRGVAAGGVEPLDDVPAPDEGSDGHRREHWILVGFCLSGFAALVFQLAWIRELTLVIGSSVYAFSATVTSFLIGIGIGSLLSVPMQRRGRSTRILVTSLAQFGIALLGLTSLCMLGALPGYFLRALGSGVQESFWALQGTLFGFCLLVMMPSTIALGVVFPLVTTLWVEAQGSGRAGKSFGMAYAANTVGAVLGAISAGLLLLPAIGTYHTVLVACLVSTVVGGMFWWRQQRFKGVSLRAGAVGIAGILILGAVFLPRWNRLVMTAGLFYHSDDYLKGKTRKSLDEIIRERRLLYYKEGIDGTVSVVETPHQRLLVINGKADASSRSDLPTQTMLGFLPIAAHPRPASCLVIGLGSGVTAGAVASCEWVEELEIVELSREVVEASRFFCEENGRVLSQPKVRLTIADARNHLSVVGKQYDVIVSEPSNPWISGVSNLFTHEAFENARSALAENGIMAQWIHSYKMAEPDIHAVLRTFHEVFPHVSVFMTQPGDLVLIGSEEPHSFGDDRIRGLLRGKASGTMLGKVAIRQPEQFLHPYLLDLREIAGDLSKAALNTDDRPLLEFNAPRHLYAKGGSEILRRLIEAPRQKKVNLPVTGLVLPGPRGMRLPSLGLSVESPDIDWDSVKASWLVERHVLVRHEGGSGALPANGQQILVSWEDSGGCPNQLLASFGRRETGTCKEFMRQLLGGVVESEGDARLEDGTPVNWVIRAGASPGTMAFALSWVEDSEHRPASFFSLRQMDDPGAENRDKTMREFVARFRFSLPGSDVSRAQVGTP